MELNFKTGAKESYPGEENLMSCTVDLKIGSERSTVGKETGLQCNRRDLGSH